VRGGGRSRGRGSWGKVYTLLLFVWVLLVAVECLVLMAHFLELVQEGDWMVLRMV
jgi:hypothetical protein